MTAALSTAALPARRPMPVARQAPDGLRLVPAPSHEPPYDDEPAAPVLRLVRSPISPAPSAPLPPDAVERTARADLPDARRAAHSLVQGLLEVCAGARPVSQLQRDTTPELFAQLEQALVPVRRRRAAAVAVRTTARSAPPRSLRSLHVQERADGVAEVCATVLRAGRAGALALRLEGQRGRWVCTAVAGL